MSRELDLLHDTRNRLTDLSDISQYLTDLGTAFSLIGNVEVGMHLTYYAKEIAEHVKTIRNNIRGATPDAGA